MSTPTVALLRGAAPPAARARPGAPHPLILRRRRVAGAAAAGVMALGLVLLTLALMGGAAEPGPPAGAAALVPANALAYVHVSTDPGRPAVRRAEAVAARFPGLQALAASVTGRVSAMLGGGSAVDFDRQIRPWLGNEAAFAVLNTTGSSAASLIVLDVRRRGAAQALLARAGAAARGTYDGARIYGYPTGVELAFVRHYLVLGQDSSVRASLDVASGRSPSLQDDSDYVRAAAGEPDDRVLDAYLSAAGVRRVLEARGGLLGALGVLLDQPALTGATIALSPAAGGLTVWIHRALDPTLVRLAGPRPAAFAPTLPGMLPSGSIMMLDLTGLDHSLRTLLRAAALAGIAGRIGPLLDRLGAALSTEGVDLRSVGAVFDGETAVAIVPGGGSPALVVVSRPRDLAAARATLASLEVPLAQLFPAPANGPGQVAEFNDVQVDGVTVHQLVLAPGLQLDYTVFGGLVVVSTSMRGIAGVVGRTASLSRDREYVEAVGARPDRVTSLLFLDFSQLLRLGEQTGLMSGASFDALLPDLEKVRAIGLYSTSGESDTTAELHLQIP